MNLQELFDKYPALQQILDFLDHYGGLLLCIAFFSLMFYIFYWIIVIAPRRVRQVFNELSLMGYSNTEPDSNEISHVVSQLAPIYPTDPREDQDVPEWSIRLAARKYSAGNVVRYVINVSRSQIDNVGKMNSTLRKTNLIIEKIELEFNDPVYIYPVKNRCSALQKSRYKLKKVSAGLDKDFLEKYNVYSPSGKIQYFPASLKDALMDSCDLLCDISRYCFQGGVTLKFQKEGWGICPANEIYHFKDMKPLIEIASKISNALS